MRIILALLTISLTMGCSMSSKLNKLDSEEYAHYMALRVYMDQPDGAGKRAKTERKAFFKLKTRAERDQWLKDKGLWDRFYQYEPHIRQKIVDGQVQAHQLHEILVVAKAHHVRVVRTPVERPVRVDDLAIKAVAAVQLLERDPLPRVATDLVVWKEVACCKCTEALAS